MRLIQTISSDNSECVKSAKVYRNSEYDEYVVKFYWDGDYMEDADYFTNCKEDAIGTATHAVNS